MKVNNDFWSIVLVGKWNRFILSPQWVGKNIFEEPGLQVEFALNLELPPRYTSNEKFIRMVPAEDRVIFFPLKQTDECLLEIEKRADKLFELLPHTPMTAFGINFGFIETSNTKLYEIFNIVDNGNLGKVGCELKETSISRNFLYGGSNLNLKITLKIDKVSFDFNFHYAVKNASEARDKLKGNIIKGKKAAEGILHSVYELDYDQSETIKE
jgi:hypothetical protein